MRTIAMGVATVGLGLTVTAVAVAADSADTYPELQEVVVTATKTGSAVSAQKVPAGLSAVSGESLEQDNIHSLEDITRAVPSLQMGTASPGDLQPIIRGIQSPGAGTVGVYFDETVVTGVNFQNGGGGTPDIGAFDIDRVEVLKGPQGTLFGASSMSGTVRFISNKPDSKDWDARISVRGDDLHDGGAGYGGDGMLNIPIIRDVLAVRAIGWYDKRGGYIDEYNGLGAVTKVSDANVVEKTGGRLMARFTPTENFTWDAYYMYQRYTDFGPQGYSDVPTGIMNPIQIITGPPFLIGLTAPGVPGVAANRALTTPSQGSNNSRVTLFGTTLTYDLSWGSIVATTSEYKLDPYFFQWDTSGTVTRYGLQDVPTFFATGKLVIDNPYQVNQQHLRNVNSNELRFSSKFAGPFNFVAGGYFQHENSDNNLLVDKADPVTGATPCQLWSQCVSNPTSPAAESILFATQQQYFINAYALFAHADYKILDNLTLGVGGRYFSQREHDIDYTLQAFQGSIPYTVPPAFGGAVNTVPLAGLDSRVTESKPTWDASLGYQVTPDNLVYVRAATGFRQGGANNSVTAKQLGVVIPDTFGPDTVTSYELGAKTGWFQHRLTLNGAVFSMLWNNMQVPGQDPSGVISFIDNAAKAKVDGAELELAARPIDSVHVALAITGLDARLTANQPDDGGPVGDDGNRIPKTPKWAFSGNADYRLPVKLFSSDVTLRTNFTYVGQSYTQFNSTFDNDLPIGDYFMMNVSANFDYQNWQFRMFVDNVTDRSPVLDIFGQGADPQQKITAEPRSVGAQVTWRFR